MMLALGAARAQQVLDGFVEYPSTYKVQSPYNLPVAQRFTDSGGMYTTQVFPNDYPFEKGNTTEPRTEMRWETWTNQAVDHLYSADVMYEQGCATTCIFQVKSNTVGEAIYLRVLDGGDLVWLGEGPTILRGGYGKWFNLKAAYNPATKKARVWIDNQLKYSTTVGSSKDWYFKNGTYTVTGKGPAVAHFTNIHHYTYDPAHWVPSSISLEPRARKIAGGSAGILPVLDVRDLLGRASAAKARGAYLIR